MSTTIRQALKQGIDNHKAGKLKEAEDIYRAILKDQPMQPHANFNLGLILISKNQKETAMRLFKNAIDANPKVEQFWVTYIDALFKNNQLEEAQYFVEKAIGNGFDEKRMKAIISDSSSANKDKLPPSEKVQSLLRYYQAKEFFEAEKLAQSIIDDYPEYPLALKVMGSILGQVGRLEESLFFFQKCIDLSQDDFEAHSNLGNIYSELGKLKEAEASYRKAISLNPNFAEAHNNLGNSLKNLGKSEAAESSFRKAILLKPEFTEAYSNLGNLLNDLGRLDEAETNYRKAIKIDQNYAEAHSNLGAVLKDLGKLDEAEISCKKAVLLKPDYDEARYNLGLCLFYSKQYEEALKQFEKIDIGLSKSYAIRCSFLKDNQSVFFKRLDTLIKDGEANAVIGSIINSSEIKYGIKKSNTFCNEPLQFVINKNLNKDYDFNEIFVSNIKDILDGESVSLKSQPFLTNGIQTAGNIFSLEEISKTPIEKIIRKEIENYRTFFQGSNEGFLKKWPSSYKLEGWLVSMKSGGKLDPHIHESGWISGSVYINVPSKLEGNSGSLVLCLDDKIQDEKTNKSKEKIINVETGSLCFFPSSLHHYTVPFKDDDDRIVLAFDVMPA